MDNIKSKNDILFDDRLIFWATMPEAYIRGNVSNLASIYIDKGHESFLGVQFHDFGPVEYYFKRSVIVHADKITSEQFFDLLNDEQKIHFLFNIDLI